MKKLFTVALMVCLFMTFTAEAKATIQQGPDPVGQEFCIKGNGFTSNGTNQIGGYVPGHPRGECIADNDLPLGTITDDLNPQG